MALATPEKLMEKFKDKDFASTRSAKALEKARPYADVIKMLYVDKGLGWTKIKNILEEEDVKLSAGAIKAVALEAGVEPRPGPRSPRPGPRSKSKDDAPAVEPTPAPSRPPRPATTSSDRGPDPFAAKGSAA